MIDKTNALIEFVLAEAQNLPPAKQIAVYRGLSDLLPPKDGWALLELVRELETAEKRFREFAFKLTQQGK